MASVRPSDLHFVNQPLSARRLFLFMVFYRWASLIPPLLYWLFAVSNPSELPSHGLALGLAVGLNMLITAFPSQLNERLLRRPGLLLIDLLLVVGLMALTGGWRTPYYLYTLSPLLAAAFFFRWRGALLAVTAFVTLYLGMVLTVAGLEGTTPDWLTVIMAVVGFYLVGSAFGYASMMLERFQEARDELSAAHRDLAVIHDLTISLQKAADVTEVEERVLEAVTHDLGFEQAVVALVDQEARTVTAWMGRARGGPFEDRLPHSAEIALENEQDPVSRALRDGHVVLEAPAPLTADESINAALSMTQAHVIPLMLRERPVGVLLVDSASGIELAGQLASLRAIANQAAVTLGTTMMCIDRAQRLAIQEERIRIARDIHDTVSQSLFGIVYTLDGSLKLLPQKPEAAIPELQRALNVAEETRAEVRKSILDIWPAEMTAERFVTDLRKFAEGVCLAVDLSIDFELSGDFNRLSSHFRRNLYRISQEALANVAHHAQAHHAQVCLNVDAEQAVLTIRDDGRGFDVRRALGHAQTRERFGLWGMRERALSMGGTCEFVSREAVGTTVLVEVPL
ncbi:MAG: histidine kinase [Candidatus Promineifilaceae bacterium]|nr:histidine kinase [Candidatus Promineifilaceae bacterium]